MYIGGLFEFLVIIQKLSLCIDLAEKSTLGGQQRRLNHKWTSDKMQSPKGIF
jgi:hypothetical protein